MAEEEIALVKSFPNEPIKRYIYTKQIDGVLLCLNEDLKTYRTSGEEPTTTKCPYSRAFQYDSDLYEKLYEAAYILEDMELLERLWKQAIPYTSNNNSEKKVISNVA